MWFLEQATPGRSLNHISLAYRLRGQLDVDLLRESLTRQVDRHEQLRLTLHAADGVPYALMTPPGPAALHLVEIEASQPDGPPAVPMQLLTEEVVAPFDLNTGPLYRFQLFRLAPEDHILMLTMHHTVSDGWSMGVFNQELAATYRALRGGAEPALPPVAARYVDYVDQQRRDLREGALEPQLRYWQKQLAGVPALELPTDRPRPAEPSFRGGTLGADLTDLLPELRTLAERLAVSLFTMLCAAVSVVLSRTSGQHDFALGGVTLGRTEPEWEQIVGLFGTFVALRIDLTEDPTFEELVERVMETLLDAMDNQDAPLEQVIERVSPVSEPGRHPLFQIGIQFVSGQTLGGDMDLPGVQVERVEYSNATARFDVGMSFEESGDRLRLGMEFATDLFDRWRMEEIVAHLIGVLTAVCADPGVRLSQLSLPAEQEQRG